MIRHHRQTIDRPRLVEAMAAMKVAIANGECTPTADEARAIRRLCRQHRVDSPVPAVQKPQRGRA